MIYFGNAPFKIDAGFNTAENLVTGAENTTEKLEFIRKQFKNALVRRICTIKKIDDDNIMSLSVTMTAPNALLDALRIPR